MLRTLGNPLSDAELDALAPAEAASPVATPPATKPLTQGKIKLPKAGPVKVPQGLPQLPPVGPAPGVAVPAAAPVHVPTLANPLSESQLDALAPGTTGVQRREFAAALRRGAATLAHPETAAAYQRLEQAAKDRYGWTLDLRSGDRTAAEQQPLWDSGRPIPGRPNERIQPNGLRVARPGISKHQHGRAIDVKVRDVTGKTVPQSRLAALAKEMGFQWFGKGDEPHFTFVGGKGDQGDVQLKSFEQLERENPLPKTTPTRPPRAPRTLTDADLDALAPEPTVAGQNTAAEMRRFAQGSRVGGPPPTPKQKADYAQQQRNLAQQQRRELANYNAVKGRYTYDSLNGRVRRPLSTPEWVAAEAARFGSGFVREMQAAVGEFEGRQIADPKNYPRYRELSGGDREQGRQVEELNQLHAAINTFYQRRWLGQGQGRATRPQRLESLQNVSPSLTQIETNLGGKLTAWQKKNFPAALARIRYVYSPEVMRRLNGEATLDVVLLGLGEVFGAAGQALKGSAVGARALSKIPNLAPALEPAAQGVIVGGPLGAVQAGGEAKIHGATDAEALEAAKGGILSGAATGAGIALGGAGLVGGAVGAYRAGRFAKNAAQGPRTAQGIADSVMAAERAAAEKANPPAVYAERVRPGARPPDPTEISPGSPRVRPTPASEYKTDDVVYHLDQVDPRTGRPGREWVVVRKNSKGNLLLRARDEKGEYTLKMEALPRRVRRVSEFTSPEVTRVRPGARPASETEPGPGAPRVSPTRRTPKSGEAGPSFVPVAGEGDVQAGQILRNPETGAEMQVTGRSAETGKVNVEILEPGINTDLKPGQQVGVPRSHLTNLERQLDTPAAAPEPTVTPEENPNALRTVPTPEGAPAPAPVPARAPAAPGEAPGAEPNPFLVSPEGSPPGDIAPGPGAVPDSGTQPQQSGQRQRVSPASNFLADERTVPGTDPRPGEAMPDGQKRVRVQNLQEQLPEGQNEIYHETNTAGARNLVKSLNAKTYRSLNLDTSADPNLALGQGGKGVVVVLDPRKVQGNRAPSLGNASVEGMGENPYHWQVTKSLDDSVDALIIKSSRTLDTLKNDPVLGPMFDFDNPVKVSRGVRVNRIGKRVTPSFLRQGRTAPRAAAPPMEVPTVAPEAPTTTSLPEPAAPQAPAAKSDPVTSWLDETEAKIDRQLGDIIKGKRVSGAGGSGEGILAELALLYVAKGAIKIARGVVKFSRWARAMKKDFPELSAKELRSIYRDAQTHYREQLLPEMEKRRAGVVPIPTAAPNAAETTPRTQISVEPPAPPKPPAAAPEAPAASPEPGRESGAPAATPEERPEYIGAINVERWFRPEDGIDDMVDFATRRGEELARQRRGTIPHEETIHAAQRLGMTLEQARKIQPGKTLNDHQLVALGDLVDSLEQRFNAAKERVADPGGDTTRAIVELEAAKAEYEAALLSLNGVRTEAGRALNALKIAKQSLRGPLTVDQVVDPAHSPIPIFDEGSAGAAKTGQAAKPKITSKSPEFGETNRLFSKEKGLAALERLKNFNPGKFLRGGTPEGIIGEALVEVLPDLYAYGGYLLEGGYRTFAAWAKEMAEAAPFLTEGQQRELWKKLREEEVPQQVRKQQERDLAMKAVLDALGGRDEILANAELLQKAARGDDPFAIAKWVRSRGTMTPREAFFRFYKGNLLLNPLSIVKNQVGTGNLVGVVRPATKMLAALLEVPIAALEKRPMARTMKGVGVGITASFREGLPKGFRSYGEVLRHGLSEEQARKLDVGRKEYAGGAANPWNQAFRLMNDSIGYEFAYAGELAERAYNQARSEGLKGADLERRFLELREDPDIIAQSEKAARYYTYNNPDNEIGQKLLQAKQTKYIGPVIEAVMPFTSTPANDLQLKVHYSPLGFLRQFMNKEALAKLPPGERAEMAAQAALGTMGLAALAAFVGDKVITGAVPDDPTARAAFYQSKRKPYSIQIPGTDLWISYQNQVWTSLFGMAAALKENYWRKGQRTPEAKFWEFTKLFLKSFTDQSFVSGLNSLFAFLDENSTSGDAAKKIAAQTAGGVIPLSALVRTVNNATDPNLRKTAGNQGFFQDVGDRLKSQVPGLSQTLPKRVDTLGKDVKREPAGFGQLQPFITSTGVDDDPVQAELNRLKVFPAQVGRDVSTKDGPLHLTGPQQEELQRQVGERTRMFAERIMRSSSYQNQTDAQRARRMTKLVNRARTQARKRFFRKAKIRTGSVDPGLEFATPAGR